jgi:transketolase
VEAADTLGKSGIQCRVLNMSSIKPIDRQAIEAAATETGAIVTAEEHLLHGGLGSIVAQVLAFGTTAPLASLGIKDTYCKSGNPEELLEANGLTAVDIVAAVKSVLARKR